MGDSMKLVVWWVLCMLAAGGVSFGGEPDRVEPAFSVVSAWRGGALTLERFIAVYDPEMGLIENGGPRLREAICKATYREIYATQARQKGLDQDPGYLAELGKWRRDQLAALYVERNRPDLSGAVTEEKLREFYEKTKADRYTSSGSVDLEVLFLHCTEEEADRRKCAERMSDYRARMSEGAPFQTLIEEEKARSGNANGVFRRVAMKSLTKDLAKIAGELPLGEFSQVIETPVGLYLLRVTGRTSPMPMAYSRVERHVRQEAAKEALVRWREGEVARLLDELGDGRQGDAGASDVLADAALAQGLDEDPAFASAEENWSSWELANRGLFADRTVMPGDEEIRRQLEDDPVVSRRFRRYSVVLAVVGVQNGRYSMIEAAERVSEVLGQASDPASALVALASREPLIDVYPIDDVGTDDFKSIDRQLFECVSGLEPGGWCGPRSIPAPRDLPGNLNGRFEFDVLPAGAAFLAMKSWRVPRIDEARDDYNRYFRSTIASCDRFLDAVGSRWDLTIQPPDFVSPVMTPGP